MPRVSVIIPTYNRADYICETVDSVLNQTYKDFEIVVIDDGSTDNTKEKLSIFGSKIKLINQKNSERAVSRNNGVKNSTGEYIAFLDSDDKWKENKLELQVNSLDQDKKIVLSYSQSLRIDDKSNEINSASRQLQGYNGFLYEKLLIRNIIVSATPLVRRESFEKIEGFKSEYIPYEDWEFWIRLSLQGEFSYINEPLAYYRLHPLQSVKLTSAEKIEKVTTSLLEDSFKLTDVNPSIKNKSLGMANLRFCYWYLIAGDIEKAREKISKALEYYPKFILDPRYYGLMTICLFPSLNGKGPFKLKAYH